MELLVALAVAGVFISGLASLLHAFTRAAGDVIRRVDETQVVRTVWVILEEELSAGRMGTDWHLDGEAGVTLRAFRGVAAVRGPAEAGGDGGGGAGEASEWVVSWVGHRSADPDRDSVLVLTAEGEWHAVQLLRVRSAGDAGEGPTLPGGTTATWEWETAGGGVPVLARLFESGRYSLEDGAFRYRRGSAGRQPLTPELLAPSSGFTVDGDGVRVRLDFAGGAGAGWTIPLPLSSP